MVEELVKAKKAAKALGVTPMFLYKLPIGTPGIYKFGKAKRFAVNELREWARNAGGEQK